MAIVCFEKVNRILPEQVSPINSSGALGPTTDPTRPTLFDPLWGYFVFGQVIHCNYDEDQAYQSLAQFTITGTFTPNTLGFDDQAGDASVFAAMAAKLNELENTLQTATQALAPRSYNEWGTASDPRCIALPKPLVDVSGDTVYGIPLSFRIEKTQFPVEIKYQAVLQEAKFPNVKLMVNDYLLDDGVVTITLPAPVFAEHEIVGASGKVLQLQHYKTMEVDVQGNMPLVEEGRSLSSDMKALAASLYDGTMDLALALRNTTSLHIHPLWTSLAVTDDTNVDVDYLQQRQTVSIRSRE